MPLCLHRRESLDVGLPIFASARDPESVGANGVCQFWSQEWQRHANLTQQVLDISRVEVMLGSIV